MVSGEREEEDVPRDITCEAVNNLRIVFATYQQGSKPYILLRHLVEIMQMMGDSSNTIPTSTKIAEMASVELAGVENHWEAEICFKDFLCFFVDFNMNKKRDVKSKGIFRALDCADSGGIG